MELLPRTRHSKMISGVPAASPVRLEASVAAANGEPEAAAQALHVDPASVLVRNSRSQSVTAGTSTASGYAVHARFCWVRLITEPDRAGGPGTFGTFNGS